MLKVHSCKFIKTSKWLFVIGLMAIMAYSLTHPTNFLFYYNLSSGFQELLTSSTTIKVWGLCFANLFICWWLGSAIPGQALTESDRLLFGWVLSIAVLCIAGLTNYYLHVNAFILAFILMGTVASIGLWRLSGRIGICAKQILQPESLVLLLLFIGSAGVAYHMGNLPMWGYDRTYFIAASRIMAGNGQYYLTDLSTSYLGQTVDLTASINQARAAFLSKIFKIDPILVYQSISMGACLLLLVLIRRYLLLLGAGIPWLAVLYLPFSLLFQRHSCDFQHLAFNRGQGEIYSAIAVVILLIPDKNTPHPTKLYYRYFSACAMALVWAVHPAKYVSTLPFWLLVLLFTFDQFDGLRSLWRRQALVAVAGPAALQAAVAALLIAPSLSGLLLEVPDESYLAPVRYGIFYLLIIRNYQIYILVAGALCACIYVVATQTGSVMEKFRQDVSLRRNLAMLAATLMVWIFCNLLYAAYAALPTRVYYEPVFFIERLFPLILLCLGVKLLQTRGVPWLRGSGAILLASFVYIFLVYGRDVRKEFKTNIKMNAAHISEQRDLARNTRLGDIFHEQNFAEWPRIAAQPDVMQLFTATYPSKLVAFGFPPHYSFQQRAEFDILPCIETLFLLNARSPEEVWLWKGRIKNDYVYFLKRHYGEIGVTDIQQSISNFAQWGFPQVFNDDSAALFKVSTADAPSQATVFNTASSNVFRFRYNPKDAMQFTGPLIIGANMEKIYLDFSEDHDRTKGTFVYALPAAQKAYRNWGSIEKNQRQGRRLNPLLKESNEWVFVNSYPFRMTWNGPVVDNRIEITLADDSQGLLYLDIWIGHKWTQIAQMELRGDFAVRQLKIHSLPTPQTEESRTFPIIR